MGIDVHCLNFLSFAKSLGADFSTVLTIGRQSVFLSDDELTRFLYDTGRSHLAKGISRLKGDGFCEQLLTAVFDAKQVDSIDASPFENASLIQDMNLPTHVNNQYSLVLDPGSLEHIFNFPVAVSNMITFCKDGGRILHMLPSNNWCGHGFYQFSPEVFFSLYAPQRGFSDTHVFLAELDSTSLWYRITSPAELKRRVNVINRDRTYVLVLTTKTANAQLPIDAPPQQSDFVDKWSDAEKTAHRGSKPRDAKSLVKRLSIYTGASSLAKTVREAGRWVRQRLVGHKDRLRKGRRDMVRMRVRDLIG